MAPQGTTYAANDLRASHRGEAMPAAPTPMRALQAQLSRLPELAAQLSRNEGRARQIADAHLGPEPPRGEAASDPEKSNSTPPPTVFQLERAINTLFRIATEQTYQLERLETL